MATILGTSGSNVINGTNDSGDFIFARAGNDLVNANAGNDLVFGELGNDVLVGGLGDDVLFGGGGNDTLNGGAGIDTADYSSGVVDPPGPVGPQPVTGATAGVTVNLNLQGVAQNTGGAGVDTLVSIENVFGTNFNDILTGNGADNLFSSLAGNDQLTGGGGNDTLNGGGGNDLLNGGTGSDTASYTSATVGVRVNLNLVGAQNTGGGGIDQLVSIENLAGSRFNDVLLGNAGNNVLAGRDGNDLLNGGAGSDTASYATATAGVTVDLDLGSTPQNTGGAGIDTLVSIENITGSKFNDRLNTVLYEPSGSTLNGADGNDTLSCDHSFNIRLNGDGGNDLLFADTSSATLNGGDGNDMLSAGDGTYTLNGGAGNDTLTVDSFFLSDSTLNGGAGADTLEHSGGPTDPGVTVTFDYNAVSDSPAGTGKDTITGFSGVSGFFEENEDGDQIDLTTIDARPSVAGNQAFIWGGPFTEGHLRYVGGVLQGNLDGDAAAEFEIQLVGAPTLVVGGAGTDIIL
jgi:Ca2+-binding RTX toxin-like protein